MARKQKDSLAQSVGKAIARHRRSRDMTQAQVAERLGIGNEAISRMERGLIVPDVERLAELAELFECQTADLLTQGSNQPRDQARYLDKLMSKLKPADRTLIINVVETLCQRLAKR